MAELNGNTWYTTAASTNAESALVQDDVQVLGIIYHTDSASQHVALNDVSGQNTAGAVKLRVGNVSAHETVYLDFSDNPIRFPKGVWVSTFDSGYLTLIIKLK